MDRGSIRGRPVINELRDGRAGAFALRRGFLSLDSLCLSRGEARGRPPVITLGGRRLCRYPNKVGTRIEQRRERERERRRRRRIRSSFFANSPWRGSPGPSTLQPASIGYTVPVFLRVNSDGFKEGVTASRISN